MALMFGLSRPVPIGDEDHAEVERRHRMEDHREMARRR